MRTYISVDLEGIAGVSHPAPTGRGDMGYPAAVALMVGEANAAIEGALAGGASDVVVNDSHGRMFNLEPADLHPAARLIQGQKPWSMLAGAGPQPLDGRGFDVALFIGFHARAGHPTATIAHTYSLAATATRLGDSPVGESGINAAVLGEWGTPVGLVSGDDALVAEIEDWLPWAERVIVKTGLGGSSAASLHPTRARALIRDGAERALRRAAAGELKPLVLEPPVVLEVDYRRGVEADHAAIVPLAERRGDLTVRIVAPDAATAYRAFIAGIRLSSIVD